MSVWLTPDLAPIAGGTYFPPVDRGFGRPGFVTILHRIARLWQRNEVDVRAQAAGVVEAMQRMAKGPEALQHIPAMGCVDDCYKQLHARFDHTHAGFGGAPKFPRPAEIAFLLRCGRGQGRDMAVRTLKMMGRGGIHDQLGGGFHRYSVDAQWRVPHFEKMLYDNAQLLHVYVEAYEATQDEALAGIVRGIVEYVTREMTSPEGGFYCAQDADSLPPRLVMDQDQAPAAAHKVGKY